MTALEARKVAQKLLGVADDGKFGKLTLGAFTALGEASDNSVWPPDVQLDGSIHKVKASSFADPADIRAFKAAKERGASDQQAFRVGDNGVGVFGDSVVEGTGASCALPPEDMIEKWGSIAAAKHKPVEVTANNKTIVAVLKDRMPHKKNITNGAGIDLNPDACRELGFEPPIMVSATWRWV